MGKALLSDEELLGSSLKEGSLQHRVYTELLGKLMARELLPGETLDRRSLAEDLGVSVAPVLVALLLLEQDGFVSSVPRKGTVVSLISEDDAAGLLVMREALEAKAARRYCGKAVRDNYQELADYAQAMDETEPLERAWMEVRLHSSLVRLAGNDCLFLECRRIIRKWFFCRVNDMLCGPRATNSHVSLINALCLDDPDTAEKAIRDHVGNEISLEEYADVLEG